MSIFGTIMDKIFHHESAAPAAALAPAAAPAPAEAAAVAVAPPPVAASVDVGAVLAAMADAKGGGFNYETSIVDLLRLLDLDSSLDARKALADELGVHAGDPGTAEQNIALHKAVIAKLAENGGVVPASMRD